jgi:hypothetical protein
LHARVVNLHYATKPKPDIIKEYFTQFTLYTAATLANADVNMLDAG